MRGGGRFVAFESVATNLVLGDTGGLRDVFVHDRLPGATVRASVAPDGTQADGRSFGGALNRDGRFVGFTSDASNLAPGQGIFDDAFVRDTLTDAPSSSASTAPVPGRTATARCQTSARTAASWPSARSRTTWSRATRTV